MAILTIKKVGNHWYPDIHHKSGADISLSPETDRFLNLFGKIKNSDTFTLFIDEVPWVTDENKIIYVRNPSKSFGCEIICEWGFDGRKKQKSAK